jgi:hypothetical protein
VNPPAAGLNFNSMSHSSRGWNPPAALLVLCARQPKLHVDSIFPPTFPPSSSFSHLFLAASAGYSQRHLASRSVSRLLAASVDSRSNIWLIAPYLACGRILLLPSGAK